MKIAAIQMVSSASPLTNMATAERLIRQAKLEGAELIALPEYWSIMGLRDQDKVLCAETFDQGPLQDFMQALAQELEIYLIGGTIPLKSEITDKIYNACLTYGPQGELVTRYDKIHLFGFRNGDESYQESNTITPGHEVGSFQLPIGKVGLGICYDLRFPELFRSMGQCSLMVLPAAFTHVTGQAHWEVLLRARAIENQCYVLASAQGGLHENGRRTWGHSMLIDPWGKIIDCVDEGEGICVGDLDLENMGKMRANLPALQHRKIAC
ncbi:carbon-nitrogen hydrolase family protein [Undibacterium cyanobacteriorum]|uniref:Carbon-nitrogen hydrolase family protein n=1 Tax=Undibacterium cyanobacteriorum TaxID=3073561 RepID=A0ABY9RMB7_9BURK|nr:carbon-nitrogen hydrolase family protein [Undibacterium sp. 20NA77.5]WMW82353.1 carbon-nitrogen hydrolase family protein [Undibacterium sp. 20NA77.5]